MAAEIIKQRVVEIANGDDREAVQVLLNALVDAVRALTVKLDADAGVTDTNYTSTLDAIITK